MWILAPLAAIVALLVIANQQTLTGPLAPVWVTAHASTDAAITPVDLAISRAAPESLYSPAWDGIVQSVDVTLDTPVRDGDSLFRVAGVERLAARTKQPFYRVIGPGDTGSDVGDLNAFLARRGLPHDLGTAAESQTEAGIRKLASQIGAAGATAFDPSWLVYLPADDYRVVKLSLAVGEVAPPTGTVIATGTQQISSVTTVTQGSIETDTGDSTSTPLDPSVVDSQAISVPAGVTLEFGGKTIPLATDRKTLPPAGIQIVQALAPASSQIVQASLVRPAGEGDIVVPSATIIAAPNGDTCVAAQAGSHFRRVTVVTEGNGQTIVRGSVKAGDRVQVFPTGDDRKCS